MADTENWLEKMQRENELLDKHENGEISVDVDAEGNLIPVDADDGNSTSGTQTATDTGNGGNGNQSPNSPSEDGNKDLLSALVNQAQATPATTQATETLNNQVSNPELEALKAKIAELEAENQRFRSENGRARVLSDELKAEREKNQRLAEQLSAKNGIKPYEGNIDEFSDEERELMSEETLKAFGGRFAALNKQNQALLARLNELEATSKQNRAYIRSGEQAAMAQYIKAKFPDLPTILQGDAWRQYCSEVDPITGYRNGELFANAVNTNSPAKVEAILTRFISAAGINVGRASGGSHPAETISGGAMVVQPGAGAKHQYSVQEVNDFITNWVTGRLPDTEQNRALYKAYSDAIDEGRVIG